MPIELQLRRYRKLISRIRLWAATAALVSAVALVTGMMAAPSARAQTFTTLFNFDGTNGANPVGPLVQGGDGNLYGTTYSGGANTTCFGFGCGTVFKVTPSGTLMTLYNFCSQTNCTDGGEPSAALVLGTDGNFYGITEFGGTGEDCPYGLGECGTVFKITPGGTLTTIYNWCSQPNCADGLYISDPIQGTFVQASDGNFYGATSGGGAFGEGTVFKLTPSGRADDTLQLLRSDELP